MNGFYAIQHAEGGFNVFYQGETTLEVCGRDSGWKEVGCYGHISSLITVAEAMDLDCFYLGE